MLSSSHTVQADWDVWERLSVLFEKRLHIDGLGCVEEQLLNHWFQHYVRRTGNITSMLMDLYTRVKDKDRYDFA